MADSFYDAPRRGNRDWPDMRLADGVAPLNRIYNDSVTVSADLVRRFVKEERAMREVLVCTAPVSGAEHKLVLEGGFEVILDGTGGAVTTAAKTLVADVSGCDTAGEVAAAVAEAVAGWLPVFVAARAGDAVGIYNSAGAGAVVSDTLGWAREAAEVGIMRPGLPPECLVGSYHPQCGYLMLVGVKLTSATDTHATFSRTWQADLVKLGEEAAVDVEAMLRMGATSSQTLEKTLTPPRQFLPWVRTVTETRKARVTEEAVARADLLGATVNEESLAASTKTETRLVWGTPYALTNVDMDPDTGDMRGTVQEVVPVGTGATATDAAGQYKTVQQVDDLWAIRTTVQAAGLAGRAVNGVATREYGYRDNYSWPRILDYLDIQPILSDSSDAYSPVRQYAWRPVWLSEGYDGPCDCRVSERWTLKQPVVGGDPGWSTLSAPESAPELPTETAMVKREVEFQGMDLNVRLPPCLHSGLWIRDSQFYQQYPASVPMRWPATILSRVTVTPDQGGWLTRMYFVDAPDVGGVGSGIDLRQKTEGAGTFTLEWTEGAGETLLDVSKSPVFAGGFLPGYPVDVTGLEELTVEAPVRGLVYYARIRRGELLVSNTCLCATKPVPELGVFDAGLALAPGGTLDVGQVTAGESAVHEVTLKNIGVRLLDEMTVTLDGADEAMFSVGTIPTSMPPGSSAVMELHFAPVSAGVKTVLVTLGSNGDGGPFLLTVTGTGAASEIRVEQPAGTEVALGGTVDFGLVTGGGSSRVFRVVNEGNAPLRGLAVTVEGVNADDFSVTAGPGVTELGAEGSANVTVMFEPLASDVVADARSAVLSIVSDDVDENPYTVNLTGTFQDPLAAGALDGAFDPGADGEVCAVAVQADGKVVLGGAFMNVGGLVRQGCARVDAAGAVDGFDPDCDGAVLAVAVQADGAVILAGEFATVGGVARAWLARVDAAGELDAGFVPVLNEEVRALAVQGDGKVIIGGDFTMVNGVARPHLARLNVNGTLDGSFESEVAGPVNAMSLLSDGRLLVTGDWEGVDEVTTPTPTPTDPPLSDPPPTDPPLSHPPPTEPSPSDPSPSEPSPSEPSPSEPSPSEPSPSEPSPSDPSPSEPSPSESI